MSEKKMHALTELLLKNLDLAFDKKAWHGPTLKGALRGIGPKEALWRPSPRHHNIWELTLHAAYWKYIMRRTLTADKGQSFPRQPSNWPTTAVKGDGLNWRRDQTLLKDWHGRLREAVEHFPPDRLYRKPSGSKVIYLDMIVGAAAHDLYHAGQIQLLKRLMRGGVVKTGKRTRDKGRE